MSTKLLVPARDRGEASGVPLLVPLPDVSRRPVTLGVFRGDTLLLLARVRRHPAQGRLPQGEQRPSEDGRDHEGQHDGGSVLAVQRHEQQERRPDAQPPQ